ncbi:hypothetical protein SLEP1_g57468 [Rubroshorea leprosula]|uniref:Uncharacterized protein n=1 Tax=Rubroshorea leprosula TaxID=152421 RepID=A0AAV5MN02_9ROSI|nr:hypothetical protein SLEP1_g57468 [Rubroshorea leprosula]
MKGYPGEKHIRPGIKKEKRKRIKAKCNYETKQELGSSTSPQGGE